MAEVNQMHEFGLYSMDASLIVRIGLRNLSFQGKYSKETTDHLATKNDHFQKIVMKNSRKISGFLAKFSKCRLPIPDL